VEGCEPGETGNVNVLDSEDNEHEEAEYVDALEYNEWGRISKTVRALLRKATLSLNSINLAKLRRLG
jgi:hypothetical protein